MKIYGITDIQHEDEYERFVLDIRFNNVDEQNKLLNKLRCHDKSMKDRDIDDINDKEQISTLAYLRYYRDSEKIETESNLLSFYYHGEGTIPNEWVSRKGICNCINYVKNFME